MALEPKNNLFTAPFMLNTIDSIGRWLGFTCQGHFVITQKDRLLEELLYLLLKAKHCLTRKSQCGNKKSRPYKNEWQMKAFFSPTDENPRLHFLGCHVIAYGGSWIAAAPAQHGDVGGEEGKLFTDLLTRLRQLPSTTQTSKID